MTYNIAYIYHHKSEYQSVSTQTHIWIDFLDVKAFTFYVFGFTNHRLEQVIFQVTTFSLSDLPSITINYHQLPTSLQHQTPVPRVPRDSATQSHSPSANRGGELGPRCFKGGQTVSWIIHPILTLTLTSWYVIIVILQLLWLITIVCIYTW